MTWTQFTALLGTAGAIFVGDPGPERGDLTGLRGEVRGGLRRERRTSTGSAPRTSPPASRAPSWSTAARPRPRWSTGRAGGARSPACPRRRSSCVVLLFLTEAVAVHAERGAVVGGVPDRHRAHRPLGMAKVWRARRDEFAIAAMTAVVVVAVGVEQAIVLAIVLSIIDHLRRSYHPNDTVVVTTDTVTSSPRRWRRGWQHRSRYGRLPVSRPASTTPMRTASTRRSSSSWARARPTCAGSWSRPGRSPTSTTAAARRSSRSSTSCRPAGCTSRWATSRPACAAARPVRDHRAGR